MPSPSRQQKTLGTTEALKTPEETEGGETGGGKLEEHRFQRLRRSVRGGARHGGVAEGKVLKRHILGLFKLGFGLFHFLYFFIF